MEQTSNSRIKVVQKKNCSGMLSFVHSFRPIHYFSRVFGLMPFSIVHDSRGELQKPKVSFSSSLWFVISICIYSFMAYSVFKNMKIAHDSSLTSTILLVGDDLLLASNFIFGAVIVLIDMCNRLKLTNILKDFMVFDEEVGLSTAFMINNYPSNRCRQCRWPALEFVPIIRRIIVVLGFTSQ